MTIQQAIEKAGPNGKGRLDDAWRFEIHHGVVTFFVQGTQAYSLPESIFADDGWQVVEPETIEVGDAVAHRNMNGEYIVRAIELGRTYACLSKHDGDEMDMYAMDLLTLIRKGPKKIKWPATITKIDLVNGEIILRGLPLQPIGLGNVSMTLEEMEEKVGTERGWHDA